MWHLSLWLSILGYGLTWLLLPVVLLVKKRQPVSSVAWMLAILFLPVAGALLFLAFGINRVERRRSSMRQLALQCAELRPEPAEFVWQVSDDARPETRCLARLAERITGWQPTRGNQIELLTDTNRTLGLIEQAIRDARQSIHLEYYIWQPDKTGTRLRDLLIQKAREGVRVRFLYDGLGSWWLTRRFFHPMHEAGIQVATFLPGQTFRERWSFNLRNHRKIAVVDGQVAFTGGMNIGDEYIGRDPQHRFWRDAHLRIVGPEVWRLQNVFAEDWLFATGESLFTRDSFADVPSGGSTIAHTIASGPDEDLAVMQAIQLEAINEAKQQILLTTSYFVPPSTFVTALENAALRGVRVRLLVSGRFSHIATRYAGRSAYDSLLAAGVEIYEYQRGLLHSKTLTIDGHWSLVGSANLDCRSLFLNFEVGVALLDGPLANQLAEQFDRDVTDALWIKPGVWSRRPRFEIVLENFCRLFQPVM